MNIHQTNDYTALSRKAALLLAGELLHHPDGVFGLATGGTPVGLYKELVALHKEGVLDFSRIRSFNLDEYYGCPRSDPNSYYSFMWENLFAHVNIRAENITMPNGEAPDPVAECARYEQAIADAGGIELQLLGIGHNGHIGFNEPDDHFTLHTHHVQLSARTIQANSRFYASADEVPKSALSMGIGTIFAARRILLVVSGEDKRSILREALFGPVTPRVPASILQLHPDLNVVCDFPLE